MDFFSQKVQFDYITNNDGDQTKSFCHSLKINVIMKFVFLSLVLGEILFLIWNYAQIEILKTTVDDKALVLTPKERRKAKQSRV